MSNVFRTFHDQDGKKTMSEGQDLGKMSFVMNCYPDKDVGAVQGLIMGINCSCEIGALTIFVVMKVPVQPILNVFEVTISNLLFLFFFLSVCLTVFFIFIFIIFY